MFGILKSMGVIIFIFLIACFIFGYGFYVTFIKDDSGEVNLNMEIPTKVSMGDCCSVLKSSEAAYCNGGWALENLDGPKWSTEKCDKSNEYLGKCDEKYKFDKIPCEL